MRLLDPNLLTSESGKILVRDNVIVFSIEHVRLLITADSVIIPREGFDHHPLNIRFNSLLDEVIADFAEVPTSNFSRACLDIKACCSACPQLPSTPRPHIK
jgi:hypothetical protein